MTQEESHKDWKNKPKRNVIAALMLLVVFVAATVVFAKGKTVLVEASVLNVRTGPGLSYDIMTQVVENEQLKVLDEKNEWYKVRLADDQIGWVASWLVKNTEVSSGTNYIGTVIGDEANIRKEANTSSQIIGTATKGTELTVLFSQNNWVQVEYLGQVAWISGELIDISDKIATSKKEPTNTQNQNEASQYITILQNGTNIRTGPSTAEASIHKANKGETFGFIESENDWYKISMSDGTTGYVASWVVELSASETPISTQQISTFSKATSLAEATIVIDAGHGGKDPGAVDNNLIEKELTMKTAHILAQKLKAFGTNVILTRSDDRALSLNDRVYLSHQANADAFISIHYDAIDVANSVSGTSTYYFSDSDRLLAETINQSIAAKGPLKNNGVKKGNYLVLRENRQPSVLLELGYINSSIDASYIHLESYQSLIADQIVQAMTHYFTN